MTATTPAKTLNKSDFIRNQPTSLGPSEVVAKGKAEGIKFTSQLVYNVRGRSKAKKKAKTNAAKKASTSPTSTAAPAKTKSKADFVRTYPSLSPKEIVEKARAAGVKFDVAYVYRVRAMGKTTRKAKSAAAKTTTPAAVNGAVPSVALPAASSSTEDLLRAVAAELGLGRAVEILAGERERVRAVLNG
jgi:hypothetical protein